MIGLIDTKLSNLSCVRYCLERTGKEVSIVTDAAQIEDPKITHIILPGVGHFTPIAKFLDRGQWREKIFSIQKPYLGICLGMHLLLEGSQEGKGDGLGIIKGQVTRIKADRPLPHMGWNTVVFNENVNNQFKNLSGTYFYANTYCVERIDCTRAVTGYEQQFSAMIQKNNFTGVQFHPEKSGKLGEIFLKRYLEISLENSFDVINQFSGEQKGC